MKDFLLYFFLSGAGLAFLSMSAVCIALTIEIARGWRKK